MLAVPVPAQPHANEDKAFQDAAFSRFMTPCHVMSLHCMAQFVCDFAQGRESCVWDSLHAWKQHDRKNIILIKIMAATCYGLRLPVS